MTTISTLNNLSNYDIIFLIIIFASTIFALFRGGIAEILSLSTWFIALWSMHKFGAKLNQYLPHGISNQLIRSVLIYLFLFICVAIIITLIKKLLDPMISNVGLSGLNRLIGGIFGIVRGLLICAIIIVLIDLLSLDKGHTWQGSKLYSVINPIVLWIIDIIHNTLGNVTK